MPTADALYMYDDYSAYGFGIWSGNPDLNPEKSKTYDIGLDFSKKSVSGGITYFHTIFENKISYAYDPVDDVTRYENVDGATISGIEGTLKFDIGAFFNWSYELSPYASLTYLTEYEDEEEDEDLLYTPKLTASYGLCFANPDIGFVSKLDFAYIDKQDITDYAGTGETTLDSYTVVDLMVAKTLFPSKKYGDVSIKAEIRNLFDEAYAVVQGYPMPGRTFYFGLKYVY